MHRPEHRELELDDPRRLRRASKVVLHADLRDVGVLVVLLGQMNEEKVAEREKVRRLVDAMDSREEEREREVNECMDIRLIRVDDWSYGLHTVYFQTSITIKKTRLRPVVYLWRNHTRPCSGLGFGG